MRYAGEITISDRNSGTALIFPQSRITAKTRAIHKHALRTVYIHSLIAFLIPCNATSRKWIVSPQYHILCIQTMNKLLQSSLRHDIEHATLCWKCVVTATSFVFCSVFVVCEIFNFCSCKYSFEQTLNYSI